MRTATPTVEKRARHPVVLWRRRSSRHPLHRNLCGRDILKVATHPDSDNYRSAESLRSLECARHNADRAHETPARSSHSETVQVTKPIELSIRVLHEL